MIPEDITYSTVLTKQRIYIGKVVVVTWFCQSFGDMPSSLGLRNSQVRERPQPAGQANRTARLHAKADVAYPGCLANHNPTYACSKGLSTFDLPAGSSATIRRRPLAFPPAPHRGPLQPFTDDDTDRLGSDVGEDDEVAAARAVACRPRPQGVPRLRRRGV